MQHSAVKNSHVSPSVRYSDTIVKIELKDKISQCVEAFNSYLTQGESLKSHIKPVMDKYFGSSADGMWDRRMAYDVCETALALYLHTHGKGILKSGDHKAILQNFLTLEALMPTEYVRSEEQVKFQQFSTPIFVGYIAYLATQVQDSDCIIEPSAGTGLLCALAKSMGANIVVNEYTKFRTSCLNTIYDTVYNTDAKYLADTYKDLSADVVMMNPPFSRDMVGKSPTVLALHIESALSLLKDNGRLVLITGENFTPKNPKFKKFFQNMKTRAEVLFTGVLPRTSFAKSGTGVDTRLTVIDKSLTGIKTITEKNTSTLAEFASVVVRHVRKRNKGIGTRTTQYSFFPELHIPGFEQKDMAGKQQQCLTIFNNQNKAMVEQQPVVTTTGSQSKEITHVQSKDIAIKNVVDISYKCVDPLYSSEENGMYHTYTPQVLHIAGAKQHPTNLVQSMAMSSVSPPPCSYVPKTYGHVLQQGILSDAQLETVIYAGEQHEKFMTGKRQVTENGLDTIIVNEQEEGAYYRKGFFLGDGTGCGKGRQVSAIILDNMLQGRKKALWISKSDKLYQDAIRDWKAVGGEEKQVVAHKKFKRGQGICLASGILFSTYSILRSKGIEQNSSRLEQVLQWLGKDFDGVIAFDESHAMSNAISVASDRGVKKASLQGMVGLKLQNLLPNARILYVSATGATHVTNLAYADRLGLWATKDFPFTNRGDFIDKMQKGGIAAMEIISRDLKALGLYTARSLSYKGVEVDILTHTLSEEQTKIYNTYADAFKQIHRNLLLALESTNITLRGSTANKQALSTAKASFESNKQRFFNHLLTAMKCPSLFSHMEKDLRADNSVIVQLVSTGEALLERRLLHIPKNEWQDLQVDLTPREYILEYLRNSFPTALYKVFIDEEGVERSEIMRDENGNVVLNKEAIKLRDDVLDMVCSLPPVESAIDQIIKHFGKNKVAEVTGRHRRVILGKDAIVSVENRSSNANIEEANAFMDFKKRILVFSDAGGTGRSYHADLNCRNQQRRVHYLLEAGWRADNAVQGLGRSNRTNQAIAPIFRPVTTNVKGERRFISTIAKRLDGLGAMTKGQRQTGGQGMFKSEDNLENDYAKSAMRFLLQDIYFGKAEISLQEFEDITALKLTRSDGTLKENLPPISQVLNRVLALKIDRQNALFDIFNMYLSGVIEQAKADGTFEEGVKCMQALSFEIVKREVVYTHASSKQSTMCFTIKRKDKVRFTDVNGLIERYGARAKFVMNTANTHVAIKTPAPHITTDCGIVRERVYLHRVSTKNTMEVKDFAKSRWVEIEKEKFDKLWQQQKASAPVYTESHFHILTGLLLPVWDILPNDTMVVKRLRTNTGQVLLGRLLSKEDLQSFCRRLGVEKREDFGIKDAVKAVTCGEAVWLSKSICVRQRLVNGEHRFEVLGYKRDMVEQVKACGGFTEIIRWQLRLFVPETCLTKVFSVLVKGGGKNV